jgi:hypothetical protein
MISVHLHRIYMVCFLVSIRIIVPTHLSLAPAHVLVLQRKPGQGECPLGATRAQLEVGMHCKSCGSVNQKKFSAEMAIHFPELKDIDKPVVWIFPEVVVCLDCGTAEFAVPEAELRQLAKGDAAAAG